MVCSCGIACKVYDPGVASTAHTYYGLGIADLSWGQMVEWSTRNSVVIERVKKGRSIWFEASLSSQWILELVNAIQHRLSDFHCNRPFGGGQVTCFSWRVPPITPSSEWLWWRRVHVTFERQTWFQRHKQGNLLGSICQSAIALAYAVTCHISQGLTLSAAVVRCSKNLYRD